MDLHQILKQCSSGYDDSKIMFHLCKFNYHDETLGLKIFRSVRADSIDNDIGKVWL